MNRDTPGLKRSSSRAGVLEDDADASSGGGGGLGIFHGVRAREDHLARLEAGSHRGRAERTTAVPHQASADNDLSNEVHGFRAEILESGPANQGSSDREVIPRLGGQGPLLSPWSARVALYPLQLTICQLPWPRIVSAR